MMMSDCRCDVDVIDVIEVESRDGFRSYRTGERSCVVTFEGVTAGDLAAMGRMIGKPCAVVDPSDMGQGAGSLCADCGGTGEYVGLSYREECKTCGGQG